MTLPKEISQDDKILILSELGLQPKAISAILRTTPNTVSVQLYKMKKDAASKEAKESKTEKTSIDQSNLTVEQSDEVSQVQANSSRA